MILLFPDSPYLVFPICDCRLPIEKNTPYCTRLKSEIGNRQLAMFGMAGRPRLLHQKKQLGRPAESSNSDLGDAVTGVAGHVSNSLSS